MSAHITGQGNTKAFADLALLISASVGEDAGAACHKRLATKGLPQCMDKACVLLLLTWHGEKHSASSNPCNEFTLLRKGLKGLKQSAF